MKIISYYYDKNPSISTFYKDRVSVLSEQLKLFGHELNAEHIDFKKLNLEQWDKLTLFKPVFILEKLLQYKEPVLWLDADASVRGKITEFDNVNCDMGFAIREHDNLTPHAAVLYFAYTAKSIEFLEKWKRLCEEKMYINWDCTEHCILVDLFNSLDNSYSVCKFYNFATVSLNTKIKIGISPSGWEYERNKK